MRRCSSLGGRYTNTTLPRSMADLARSALRLKQYRPAVFRGQWLLMTDRIQIAQGTLVYDIPGPPKVVVHQNGATSHVLNGAVTGANMMWGDGSVLWRPVPGEISRTPWPNENNNNGPQGFIRDACPYTDVIIPYDTCQIRYGDLWGAYVEPLGFTCQQQESIALEDPSNFVP